MIKRINDRISVVFTESGFSSGNCMLVEDDVALMIDSGAGSAILEARPDRIELLLNSHHHLDHMGGNDFFANARIMAHPLERASMTVPQRMTAMELWDELMDEENFLHSPTIFGEPNRLFQPWRVDEDLREGQVIDCGVTRIAVVHTPGHTAGHCSFHFPDEDLVFMADICLTRVGPWYGGTDSVIDEFLASVDRIMDLRPAKIVTGHSAEIVTEHIDRVVGEYRDRILRREERILDHLLKHSATINEMAALHFIYPEHPTAFVLYWEKSMLKNHLERLIAHGEAERCDDGRYGALSAPHHRREQ